MDLNDVYFGDVWVCSGQSNMEWRMSAIFNASQEVQKSAEYWNIKLYRVQHITMTEPQDDLVAQDFDHWADTSESNMVSLFSAMCLLTAQHMSDVLGKTNVLFGLIESNWGGTIVEAWMPQEPLDLCQIEANDDNGPNSNSVLYNGMIHPLIR